MTGIGGQGVQLAGEVLARAAIARGLQVQRFGSYGGMMRGGNTDVTLVFADGPIEAPPTVSQAWSAIVMHPAYAPPTISRVRPDGIIFVNSTVCPDEPIGPTTRRVPATDLAIELGTPMVASMVMIGAYAAETDLVGLDDLTRAVAESLPSYRSQHIELNTRALHAGFNA